ncbi:Uma2 family endonuclease [Neolewinella antarctica]|uniref:Uma2 family endonuclease n=1 Tax=Neolewinella antarctica TaxID=442734 RepID=A0ABX0XAW6_9BACT|nr:Uma2 family endonuclease [Neolewinella antarctica]NJC26416.1 Uma2 family endonuclease [Neolewinella antarctica]
MGQPATTKDYYTKDEYFRMLEASDFKIEYHDGKLRMMTGGKIAHNDIIDNIYLALATGQKKCKVKNSENAVAIESTNKYVFPDLTATCGKPTYQEGGIARLTNPNLIVEVLSPSTAEYDRNEKFSYYRSLESFQEYVLIDSRKLSVESFYRETHELWHIGSYYNLDQSVMFHSLGIEVPMQTIYADIDFSLAL